MNNQKRCNICDILLDNDSTHNKSIGVNIDGEDYCIPCYDALIFLNDKPRKKKGNNDFGNYAPYDCAVYKYPRRNDKYLIFRLFLKTEIHNSHWRLRGVCLLGQVE